VDGKAVFVDNAFPGDILEAEIYSDKKNYSFAGISEIIKPSAFRVESPCPNAGKCGGCSYLHIDYSQELEFKKTILKENLARIAMLNLNFEPDIISDQRFNYRSHSSVKCSGLSKGFYFRGSNSIVEFPSGGCLLLAGSLNEGLKSDIRDDKESEWKIAEDWKGNFVSGKTGDEVVAEKTGEYFYNRGINNFFQSNKFLRKKMQDLVCDYSELTDNDQFADICSGCGFFTIPLSKLASNGSGYDIDRGAIKYAWENAKLNNCNNIKFFALSEADINPARLSPKTVVVDPPRSGLTKKGRRTINAINPQIIVYVSCNPSTYARDIADFLKNGYYPEKITLIDMFPCTHHIEIISKLVKVKADRIVSY
jgi:23S rRNA (uracil1939-C5)-methyltransferase